MSNNMLPPPTKTGMIRDDNDDKKTGGGMSKEKKECIYHLCVFIFLDILAILGLYATVTSFIYHNDFIVEFLPMSIFILAFIGAVGVIGSIFLTMAIIETLGEIIVMEG